MTWPWRNSSTAIIALISLALFGQGCSISLGSSAGLDGGVFRSDDHGQSWQQKNFVSQSKQGAVTLNDVSGRALVFDPRNSDHLYLATRENGIWVTTNGGDQWQATSIRSGDYECLDLDPLNANIVYTAAGSLVLKSTTGGQSWTTVYTETQPGQTVTCVAVDPSNGQLIWATTSGGKILLSQDYGQTWTLQTTLAAFLPRRIFIDPAGSGTMTIFTRGNGIWVGRSRGSQWVDLSKPLQAYSGAADIRSVDIEPSGWYLATAYGVLHSVDQGQSWTPMKTLVTPGSVPIQNVAVNPRQSQEIFLTTNQKVHHTTDGGQTWSVSTLPTARLPVLLTFDPTKTDRLFVSTFKLK